MIKLKNHIFLSLIFIAVLSFLNFNLGYFQINKAQAAISFISSAKNQSKTAGTTLILTVPVGGWAAGSSVIVTVTYDDINCATDIAGLTLTDTASNSYSLNVTSNNNNTFGPCNSTVGTDVFSAHNIIALSAGNTLTVTFPVSITAKAAVAANFTGLATTATFDKLSYRCGPAAGGICVGINTFADSGTTLEATTQPEELLIGVIGIEGPLGDAFTKDTNYTLIDRNGTTGGGATSNVTTNTEYRIVSSTGMYNAIGTLGTGRNWLATIATYKAAPPPDFLVSSTDISFSNSAPNLDDDVTVTATIHNNGGAWSGNTSPLNTYYDNTNGASQNANYGIYASQWLAQSFTPATTISVSKVSLYMLCSTTNYASNCGQLTVKLQTDSGGLPSGTALATAVLPNETAANTIGWIDVNFPEYPTLTGGTKYWIVTEGVRTPLALSYGWASDNTAPTYTGGNLATSAGAGQPWTAQTTIDAWFRVYGGSNAPILVKFFDDDPDVSGVQIGNTQAITSIAAGSTSVAQVIWPAGAAGARNIFVHVDRDVKITETDETNNKSSKAITVASTTPAAPTIPYAGYPSAQTGATNWNNATGATPLFSIINNHSKTVTVVQVQLTTAADVSYSTPIWNSGDITGMTSTANAARTPDIPYGIGAAPASILQAGQSYIWRVRTKGAYYSEWSANGVISMASLGSFTARFYEDKDTTYGTVYNKGGYPDLVTMYSGGWGDAYYSYLEWANINLGPSAADTTSANLYLYNTTGLRPNNPNIYVEIITQSWTEGNLYVNSNPTSTITDRVLMPNPPAGWVNTNITNIYKDWKNSTFTNYGIKLNPTTTASDSNGYWSSSDTAWYTTDPYLEVNYAVPVLSQNYYRFRDDTATLDTNSGWLSSLPNVPPDNPVAKNTTIRLRTEIANTSTSPANNYTYRLQYAPLSGTCSASAYTDVPVTPAAEHWKMVASSQYIDGNNITISRLTPTGTFVNGKGIANPSNQTAAFSLVNGSYTEFEYAIQATSNATDGGTYCFRMLNGIITTNFIYSVYPQATLVISVLNENYYRFRDDTATLDTNSGWLSSLPNNPPDNPVAKNTTIRLRAEIANTGTAAAAGYTYRLQYAPLSGTCSASAYTDVPVTPTTEHWKMAASSQYIDGNNTIISLLTPTGTFVNGKGIANPSNQTAAFNLVNGNYTEFEYAIQATSNATDAGTYCFRILNGTITTNFIYSVYPQATLRLLPPTISTITPNSGYNNAPISITSVTGTGGFVSTPTITTVKLTRSGQPDISCTGFTFTDSTTLSNGSCPIAGVATGPWNVVVTNFDAQTNTLVGGFTISLLPPAITAINPNEGNNNVAISITSITGTGFVSTPAITSVKLAKIGQPDISCTGFIFTSSTILSNGSCPITGVATGVWDVVVTNFDSQTDTKIGGFTIYHVITGYLISSTFDTGHSGGVTFNSIMYKGIQGTGGTVRFQLASSNSPTGPWSYIGPGGSSSTTDSYITTGSNAPVAIIGAHHNNKRYYRYKIYLDFKDIIGLTRPVVNGVIVNWSP